MGAQQLSIPTTANSCQNNTYCPPEATGLAMCACQRNQNSLRISQIINSSVRYSCASHSADITSAQELFSAYFRLAASGTSAFPAPLAPPGDSRSSSKTAKSKCLILPNGTKQQVLASVHDQCRIMLRLCKQFKSLASCAQYAVSFAIHSLNQQTNTYCPQGVQALASCVCLKESMSGSLSSSIRSNVKWSCFTTASQDVVSALSVFDFYCSAARGEVKATAVTDPIAQSYTPAQTGSASRQPDANQLGVGDSGLDSLGGSSGPNMGLIAGAVVGVVVLLALIGIAVFFLVRRGRGNRAATSSRDYGPPPSPEHHYKPGLDSV